MFQHYVSRFYLQNFAINKKNSYYISVFDLQTNNCFPINIKKIAGETNYNNVLVNEEFLYSLGILEKFKNKNIDTEFTISIESALTEIENNASPAITKIITQINPNSISLTERIHISIFCAISLLRVPRLRNMVKDISKVANNTPISEDIKKALVNLNENKIKFASIQAMLKMLERVSIIIFFMKWRIGYAKFNAWLHTSDNPITIYHPLNNNCKIGEEGSKIIFPLSRYILLEMSSETDYAMKEDTFYFDHEEANLLKKLLVKRATRYLFASYQDDFTCPILSETDPNYHFILERSIQKVNERWKIYKK